MKNRPLRITWVSFARIDVRPDGGLTSDMASVRYRILLPLQHLDKTACRVQLLMITADEANAQAFAAMQADVVIFSKSFFPVNEALAQEAHKHGARVIFDLCDDCFEHPQAGEHYRRMAEIADLLVCNTPAMAELARGYAATPARIIEDPVEGPAGEPRFSPQDRLNLLWFGNSLNLDSLAAAMPGLAQASERLPLALTVMTRLEPQIERWLARDFGKNLQVRGVPWSLAGQWQALRQADAVIIPSLGQSRKNVKSANRLVEAFRAGRMVVANPVPSYLPFADWAWIGEALEEGLHGLMAQADAVPRRIAAAQAHIEAHYAAPVIAGKWQALLQEMP